ncbi:MAG: ATP-dependent ligase [Massilia sp.]|nr:ATP-dependent ligase [Massilia sp.]
MRIRGWVQPMLTRSVERLPTSEPGQDSYRYEPKFDGFRCLVTVDDNRGVHLTSRRGSRLNEAFPEIVAAAFQYLPAGTIADGELVRWSGDRLDFAALQRRATAGSRVAGELARTEPSHLVIFDVLETGDEDLRPLPLAERRQRLEQLFAPIPAACPLTLSMHTADAAEALLWLEALVPGRGSRSVPWEIRLVRPAQQPKRYLELAEGLASRATHVSQRFTRPIRLDLKQPVDHATLHVDQRKTMPQHVVQITSDTQVLLRYPTLGLEISVPLGPARPFLHHGDIGAARPGGVACRDGQPTCHQDGEVLPGEEEAGTVQEVEGAQGDHGQPAERQDPQPSSEVGCAVERDQWCGEHPAPRPVQVEVDHRSCQSGPPLDPPRTPSRSSSTPSARLTTPKMQGRSEQPEPMFSDLPCEPQLSAASVRYLYAERTATVPSGVERGDIVLKLADLLSSRWLA